MNYDTNLNNNYGINYNGDANKNKQIFKVILISCALAILLIGYIIFRLISLREIIIEDPTIQLLPGESYTINYTTKPKYKKKDKYTWITNNEKAISVNNGVITAIGEGEAKVWIKSKDNPDIFTTVDVVVKNKITRFRERLVKNFGYTIVDNDKVALGDTYTLDTSNKTFQFFEGDTTYTFYYQQAYVYINYTNQYEQTEYQFIIPTGEFNCRSTGNTACSPDHMNGIKAKIDTMLTYFYNYLGRDYSVEDI